MMVQDWTENTREPINYGGGVDQPISVGYHKIDLVIQKDKYKCLDKVFFIVYIYT